MGADGHDGVGRRWLVLTPPPLASFAGRRWLVLTPPPLASFAGEPALSLSKRGDQSRAWGPPFKGLHLL